MVISQRGNVGAPPETTGAPMRTTTCESAIALGEAMKSYADSQTGTTQEMEIG